MRTGFIDFFLIMVVAACSGLPTASSRAQSQDQPSSAPEDPLKGFLQDYVGLPGSRDGNTTSYFSALIDLKGDGTREAIVYLMGDDWCGSGGCTTLILAPQGSSYKVVTKITVTRPPIRVLTTKSNGWHDIAVRVQGGGIARAYEAKLSFDGKTYPRNPSTPPARRLIQKVAGKVVVPSAAKGTPLH